MTIHQYYIIISAKPITSKLKLISFNMLVFLLTQRVISV